MKQTITISLDDIRLRPLTEQDLEKKVRWINDPDVNKYLHYELPLELEKTKKWLAKTANDETRYDFATEKIEKGEKVPIGLIGLLEINKSYETAEFYITVGEKKYWKKGLGQKSLTILVEWAFNTVGLHKIWGTVRVNNLASIALMKKVGFKIEGTLREEKKVGNKRFDVVRVGLLRHEFHNPYKEK